MVFDRLLAAALTCVAAGAALAQAPKKTVGTVVAMVDGDTACHLTLKDDAGALFKEMADFDICARRSALLNVRVNLTYRQQRVMSPECQGDPACKKSTTVTLVSAATPVATPAATRTSFCVAPETVVFECRTGEKTISVCASGDATARRGYLQYHFGALSLGQAEVTVPTDRVIPPKAATGEAVPFSGGGGAWLRFARGQVSSTVYTGIGNWGPRGETREKAGLVVARGGKTVAALKCVTKPRSELGPDLFGKLGIKNGDGDFDFPD